VNRTNRYSLVDLEAEVATITVVVVITAGKEEVATEAAAEDALVLERGESRKVEVSIYQKTMILMEPRMARAKLTLRCSFPTNSLEAC